MMKLNNNLKQIKASQISEFNKYLKTIPNINLLTYGEPYMPPDKEIKIELINSILKDNDRYISSSGNTQAKEAICEYEFKKTSVKYSQDQVIVTNGSTEALFIALKSILNPHDEVILFAPFYPEYESLIKFCQGQEIIINLQNDYQIHKQDLIKKISNKTKLLIINSPNNPTGTILNQDSLEVIYSYMKKYNFYVVLDNVYDEIIYKKINFLQQYKDITNRCIICNSLSKSHRLTGWRLGYLIANKEIINQANKLKQMLNVCPPSFMMDVIKFSLNQPVNIDLYKINLKYITKQFEKLKINFIKPDGGFYVFFSIIQFNMTSYEFCKLLADKYQIGLLPGIFFHQENYVRLSFSCSYKTLLITFKKLKKALKNLTNK